MLCAVKRPKASVDALAMTCVPCMTLTSADGSGCPLAESVTTPVMSALTTRRGSAAAERDHTSMIAPAKKARATDAPMRDCANDMMSSVDDVVCRPATRRRTWIHGEAVPLAGYARTGGARGRLGLRSTVPAGDCWPSTMIAADRTSRGEAVGGCGATATAPLTNWQSAQLSS